MAKLIYRTKPPKKGFVFKEAFLTHEGSGRFDPLPPDEVQDKALRLVEEVLHDLAKKLEPLGYDPTKIRFQIHCKSLINNG